ncbi:MAG: hypothetical protein ACK4OJ_05060 [Brevundimonas sp.]
MADAYVNFYASLDKGGWGRGAQAFEGAASQPHRANGAVGASAAAATKIDLLDGTAYVEVKPTSGDVFVCLLPTTATEAQREAAKIRVDEGDPVSLGFGYVPTEAAALFIWAV